MHRIKDNHLIYNLRAEVIRWGHGFKQMDPG